VGRDTVKSGVNLQIFWGLHFLCSLVIILRHRRWRKPFSETSARKQKITLRHSS